MDVCIAIVNIIFRVLGVVFVISIVTPMYIVVLVPMAIVYVYVQRYYVRTSRELQRWESVLRAPILSFFAETLDGLASIRAYDGILTCLRAVAAFLLAQIFLLHVCSQS
jgi:ATP-binding cassette subfamily C (CFTR/MRP) protein 1